MSTRHRRACFAALLSVLLPSLALVSGVAPAAAEGPTAVTFDGTGSHPRMALQSTRIAWLQATAITETAEYFRALRPWWDRARSTRDATGTRLP